MFAFVVFPFVCRTIIFRSCSFCSFAIVFFQAAGAAVSVTATPTTSTTKAAASSGDVASTSTAAATAAPPSPAATPTADGDGKAKVGTETKAATSGSKDKEAAATSAAATAAASPRKVIIHATPPAAPCAKLREPRESRGLVGWKARAVTGRDRDPRFAPMQHDFI